MVKMTSKMLFIMLLMTNVFWLVVFFSYTESSHNYKEPVREQQTRLCPPCQLVVAADDRWKPVSTDDPVEGYGWDSNTSEGEDKSSNSTVEARAAHPHEERETKGLCVAPTLLGSGVDRKRKVAAWSESWYNNGLLQLPSEMGLPRLQGRGVEQTGESRMDDVCSGAVAEVMAYGIEVPEESAIGILWPRTPRYRQLLQRKPLQGMAVRNEEDELVAEVIEVVQAPAGVEGNVNLVLRFHSHTAAGCDALIGVVEQPYPSWVIDFQYGFTAQYEPANPDSTLQQIIGLSIILRRQRIHDYHFVHLFNPYTPRNGSHQQMELTVVQRSLEVAYNRAWEHGIRVLILAAVFEEDEAMVHYPYQRPSRWLVRHFFDPMGRKIPLMDDMLDMMWEDGPTRDSYIFTNADIGVLPDFYIDCWTIYRSDTAVPVLLREQLPLEVVDLTPPVDIRHLYKATETQGVKHTGDDCFIIPADLLPTIDYGHVFPAYPPFACFLMQQLEFTDGGRYRLRSRVTFHLGLDKETSIWINDPNTIIGRHVNSLNAVAALEPKENQDILSLFVDKCRIGLWQMELQMQPRPPTMQLHNPPPFLPTGLPGWWLGPAFPAYAYGRSTYQDTRRMLAETRADTSVFTEELQEIMGKAFIYAAAMLRDNPGMKSFPMAQHLGDLAGWPAPGVEQLSAEERVQEIRKLSNERLWDSLPKDNEVIERWMAELGLAPPTANAEPATVLPTGSLSIDGLVEELLSRGSRRPLRLVECITPGMTGLSFLHALLSVADDIGGQLEAPPKMIRSELTKVLTQPLGETRAARRDTKLTAVLLEWAGLQRPTMLDLNNMFIKTYADAVLDSPLLNACRADVLAGREPAAVLEVLLLRRPFLELVWRQAQRGWFDERSSSNQRGVWYYALEDIRERSFQVIPPLVTLPDDASHLRVQLHHIIGYDLDIEARAQRFVEEHSNDPCVRTHELSLPDLYDSDNARELLRSLGSDSSVPHLESVVRMHEHSLKDSEERQVNTPVSQQIVEDEVTAFYRAYIDAGLSLPRVDLLW